MPLALASPAGSLHTVLGSERGCAWGPGDSGTQPGSPLSPGRRRDETGIRLEVKPPLACLPVCASRGRPGSCSLYVTAGKGRSHVVCPQLMGAGEAKNTTLLAVPGGVSLLDCDWARAKGPHSRELHALPATLPSRDTEAWRAPPQHGSLPLAQILLWAVLGGIPAAAGVSSLLCGMGPAAVPTPGQGARSPGERGPAAAVARGHREASPGLEPQQSQSGRKRDSPVAKMERREDAAERDETQPEKQLNTSASYPAFALGPGRPSTVHSPPPPLRHGTQCYVPLASKTGPRRVCAPTPCILHKDCRSVVPPAVSSGTTRRRRCDGGSLVRALQRGGPRKVHEPAGPLSSPLICHRPALHLKKGRHGPLCPSLFINNTARHS